MLRILVFIALASLLAFGAVWLAERPGEVSIVWGGVTIETSVAMAAIGVLALVLLMMMLWSLLRFMLGLPTAFSFASRARKRSRGYEAVSRGMVAIGAGDPAAARRHASDARKLISDEPLTLLLSAQAAQLVGDKPAAEAAFKEMLDQPTTRVLGLRGLFVEARRRGDQVAAHAFADEAVRLSPSLAWANDALLEYHSTAGDWAKARTAVERRAALRLSDKTESKRHRAVLMAAEALAKQESDPAGALAAALDALKLDAALIPAAVLAGRALSAKSELRKAARILETAWREQPHPELADAYIHLRSGDTAGDRLEKAEALMKLKPTDPESAFVVAEAAIAVRDYARARAALSPLVAAGATVRTCLLMARIEDGEHGSAGRGREWLTRSLRAMRDNAWVADGVVSETWLPVSPVSGRLGAFAWTLPPAVLGSAGPSLDLAEDLPPLHEPQQQAMLPAAEPPPPAPEPAAAPEDPPRAQEPERQPERQPEQQGTQQIILPPPPPMADVRPSPIAMDPEPIRTADIIPGGVAQQLDERETATRQAEPEPQAAAAAPADPRPAFDPDRPPLPDDPGLDPNLPPPQKRSFWSFGAR